MHEILAVLEEDKDKYAEVYIEPNDPGLLTDEDDSGVVHNLPGR